MLLSDFFCAVSQILSRTAFAFKIIYNQNVLIESYIILFWLFPNGNVGGCHILHLLIILSS